jgi:hypothetical protein
MPNLLHHNRGFSDAQAGTAKFRRYRDAKPPACGNGLGKFEGKLVQPVFFGPIGVIEFVA